MHFEKTMCDRLGYKYKDIFSHLEFILNKMNNLLNNYGCSLSDKELEMLSQLFLKLETGKIEIIEFTKPIEKYLDVDEIYKENQELKKQLDYLRSGEYYNQLRFENEMLQQVVDTNGVPSEVYDYIDCTHRNTELLEENQKYKEVIDKVNNKLSQYKNDLKEYQEQDIINHQNISIGLVGVKIRAFEDILKEVE